MHHDLIVRPWLFKVELTRGCNLACRFCPIYALPEYSENMRFLNPDMMRRIAEGINEINPRGRVEMTMRGEPTLNIYLEDNLGVLREVVPELQLSMHTNGLLLLKKQYRIDQLFDFGLNILNIDCYNNTEDRFHALACEECEELSSGADFDLVDHNDFSAYRRHGNGHELRVVSLIPDIADPDQPISVRQIHSNAGNGDPVVLEKEFGCPPLLQTLKKKCVRPFRECVITCDGEVILCCHDWKAEAVMGHLNEQTLEEIWFGDVHLQHLRDLYNRDRHVTPCNRCDYFGGYRQGLIKDPR